MCLNLCVKSHKTANVKISIASNMFSKLNLNILQFNFSICPETNQSLCFSMPLVKPLGLLL